MITRSLAMIALLLATGATLAEPPAMHRIRVSENGRDFVLGDTGQRFIVWGVNYDRDDDHRLLEEYWHDEWDTVVGDFKEMKALGANVVRVHLQLGAFMDGPDKPNARSLTQLGKLLKLAERVGLYVDLTGLGCYRKSAVPKWYDALSERERWAAQANFWRAVAGVGKGSDALFCYDLMNEPILPGDKVETDWLGGELGGLHYVQRLALDRAGRTREQIAKAWVKQMTDAIRAADDRHLVTVGVIPWVFVFGGGKPLFHDPDVGAPLDFVAIHVYPKSGEIDKAVTALDAYDVGKPILIEETFPLRANHEEMAEFIDRSAPRVDGWVSFYWGRSIEEYKAAGDLRGALVASWLEWFRANRPAGAWPDAPDEAKDADGE